MEGKRENRAAAPLACFVDNRAALWWRGYSNGRDGGPRPDPSASLTEHLGHDMGSTHRAQERAVHTGWQLRPLSGSAWFEAIKREIAAVERSDSLFATAPLWVPNRL